MVEAGDDQAACPGATKRVDVNLSIDQEPAGWIIRDVPTAHRFENMSGVSDEQAEALERQRGQGVRRNVVERGRRDANGYKASTAIARPMPPPMQSEATP